MPAIADYGPEIVPDQRSVRLSLDRRSWMPDLASVAAFVTFLYVLFLYPGYTRLFHDSDTGWHIRSGEQIVQTLRLPDRDPYSFSRTGAAWMNWEWLADVASGAVHRVAGLAGVCVLFAAAIAAAVWCWFKVQWKLGANFLVACALAVPLLGTLQLHWLARPHIFSWVLMLGALWWAESEPSRSRLMMFAAGTAIWANVHGSFLFAPALAVLYGVCRILRPCVWRLDRKQERAAARYYFTAAGLAALASLANPYGWQLHRHVLAYLSDKELLSYVGEFQSFNFHAAGSWQILLSLGAVAAGTVLTLGHRRPDHFLLGSALFCVALFSARGLPLVALLGLPIVGGHVSSLWAALGGSETLQTSLGRWLQQSWNCGEQLGRLDRAAAGALWLLPAAAIICAAAASFLTARAGFPSSEYPEAAVADLEQSSPELFEPGARLLASDKFGGYLIYRFNGRLNVFFDGRSDFYGRQFLEDYRQLAQVRPGWQQIVKRFGFTHALLPSDAPLVDALDRTGWRILYQDDVATLLKRN